MFSGRGKTRSSNSEFRQNLIPIWLLKMREIWDSLPLRQAMQVRISNVSKLVPKETLFALFSIVGDILKSQQLKSDVPLETSESFEWNCLFANLSDAQRASFNFPRPNSVTENSLWSFVIPSAPKNRYG